MYTVFCFVGEQERLLSGGRLRIVCIEMCGGSRVALTPAGGFGLDMSVVGCLGSGAVSFLLPFPGLLASGIHGSMVGIVPSTHRPSWIECTERGEG